MGDTRGETDSNDTAPDSVDTDVGGIGTAGATDGPVRADRADSESGTDADTALAGADEPANRDDRKPADRA